MPADGSRLPTKQTTATSAVAVSYGSSRPTPWSQIRLATIDRYAIRINTDQVPGLVICCQCFALPCRARSSCALAFAIPGRVTAYRTDEHRVRELLRRGISARPYVRSGSLVPN
jgi:hypothetical protein